MAGKSSQLFSDIKLVSRKNQLHFKTVTAICQILARNNFYLCSKSFPYGFKIVCRKSGNNRKSTLNFSNSCSKVYGELFPLPASHSLQPIDSILQKVFDKRPQGIRTVERCSSIIEYFRKPEQMFKKNRSFKIGFFPEGIKQTFISLDLRDIDPRRYRLLLVKLNLNKRRNLPPLKMRPYHFTDFKFIREKLTGKLDTDLSEPVIDRAQLHKSLYSILHRLRTAISGHTFQHSIPY